MTHQGLNHDTATQSSAKWDESDELTQEQLEEINSALSARERVIAILKTIHDPEIPVSIWELGLIYELDISESNLTVKMTLTTPSCPVAELMPIKVQNRLEKFLQYKCIEVRLVWEPQWDQGMMSEDAKLLLDIW